MDTGGCEPWVGAPDDEPFVIGLELEGPEAAVRTVGAGAYGLAALAALSGLLGLAHAFDQATHLGRVTEWTTFGFPTSARMAFSYLTPVKHETAKSVALIAPWVLYMVAVPWLLVRIGLGLRRLEPWSRRAALVVLGLAALPPLAALAVSAGRGSYVGVLGALLALAAPAAGIAVLAAPKVAEVFGPAYRRGVAKWAGPRPELSPGARLAAKVVVMLTALGALLVLVAMGGVG